MTSYLTLTIWGVGAWLLPAKLVAGKGQDAQALALVLLVESLQLT